MDPTFNQRLRFELDLPWQTSVLTQIVPLDDGTHLVSGNYTWVNGLPHADLARVDGYGELVEDGTAVPGCGKFIANDITHQAIIGVAPGPDGAYCAYGSFQ